MPTTAPCKGPFVSSASSSAASSTSKMAHLVWPTIGWARPADRAMASRLALRFVCSRRERWRQDGHQPPRLHLDVRHLRLRPHRRQQRRRLRGLSAERIDVRKRAPARPIWGERALLHASGSGRGLAVMRAGCLQLASQEVAGARLECKQNVPPACGGGRAGGTVVQRIELDCGGLGRDSA